MFDKKLNWFQLSQRQRMSPFPNYLSMESVCKEMKQVIGYTYRETILIFQANLMFGFFDKKDHIRVSEGVLKKVVRQPDIFIRLGKKQKQFARSFYKFIQANNKPQHLKKFSNQKLARLHQEYQKRYKQIYSHYFPVLAMENYLFEYLNDYLESLVGDNKKVAHYLNVLLTERKAMVNRQEKIAALKLCQKIKINQIGKDKKIDQLIKNYTNNWFWITRDYDDPVLTFEDFIKRFKKHLRGNPQKELAKLAKEDEQLIKDRNQAVKKLKMDKEHQRLFQTMREGIAYKELRKKIVSKTLYYYDPILQEIARRGGLSLRQARHLLVDEAEPMLAKGQDLSQKLNQRIKLSVWHNKAGRTKVYTGQVAKQYYDFFIKIDQKVKQFIGMPISSGKARGPVKVVINPDSFHKVRKGDIIVTMQATPVFTPVLQKAAGLVCDGGTGITAHPATLAREVGIPCVTGLRITTDVLKDGEIVEVDGDKGIVKRLK